MWVNIVPVGTTAGGKVWVLAPVEGDVRPCNCGEFHPEGSHKAAIRTSFGWFSNDHDHPTVPDPPPTALQSHQVHP